MSLGLFGRTLEEYVDFDISIGLISQKERQNEINKLYKGASEILNEMLNGSNKYDLI